jgi:two-component system NarL family sensor kinase
MAVAVIPSSLSAWAMSALSWVLPFLIGVLITSLAWALLLQRDVREQTAVLLERLQSVVREFGEQKRESDFLRQSEERFRQLAENMRDIVWIVSLDERKTLFVNTAFEVVTGRDCQTLYDQPNCLDLIHPDDRAAAVYTLFKQVLEDYGGDAEFRIVRPDGAIRWVRSRAFSILKNRGDTNRIGCITEDITERKRAEKALHQLSGRLLKLQDEERRRMARELHDSTAQTLTALVMNLGIAQGSALRLSKNARQALAESMALAQQCAREVRTISYLLHPPLLEELGLVSALRNYVEGYSKRSGIQVELEVATDFGRLPQEIELALFRVAQESLTNVHRHSGSATAKIRMIRDEDGVTLEIKDEGRGMPPEKLDRAKRIIPGLGVGIAGMQERLEQLGGRLETLSGGEGTTVRAIVPGPFHS